MKEWNEDGVAKELSKVLNNSIVAAKVMGWSVMVFEGSIVLETADNRIYIDIMNDGVYFIRKYVRDGNVISNKRVVTIEELKKEFIVLL